MKNYIVKAFVLVSALTVASHADAYVYGIANLTDKDYAIGLQFISDPNIEYYVIPANTRGEFRPGSGGVRGVHSNIGRNKVGFIASHFSYVPLQKDATTGKFVPEVNESTRKNLAWRDLPIIWLESEEYKIAIGVAEAVGKMAETVGKTAAKAGAAYATGGASVAADAAADVAEKAAKKVAGGKALQEFADSDFNLGKFFAKIGKSAARSLAANREFKLIEDEDGNLTFVSRI